MSLYLHECEVIYALEFVQTCFQTYGLKIIIKHIFFRKVSSKKKKCRKGNLKKKTTSVVSRLATCTSVGSCCIEEIN